MKNGFALPWHLQEALRPQKTNRATPVIGRKQTWHNTWNIALPRKHNIDITLLIIYKLLIYN